MEGDRRRGPFGLCSEASGRRTYDFHIACSAVRRTYRRIAVPESDAHFGEAALWFTVTDMSAERISLCRHFLEG